jgi:hypothetical protein
MTRWIISALLVVLLGAGLWWYLQRSPYTGRWVNIAESSDTLTIRKADGAFEVQQAGSDMVRMQREDDRLRPASFGSTLQLIYDAPTDQLRHPIFSDTERRYRRAD